MDHASIFRADWAACFAGHSPPYFFAEAPTPRRPGLLASGSFDGVCCAAGSAERVHAWLNDPSGSEQLAHVEFRDDGGGLPAGREVEIFDPYVTTKSATGGSGIGLSLSRKLAASALGGTLTARTHPDGGASFLLVFPVRAA